MSKDKKPEDVIKDNQTDGQNEEEETQELPNMPNLEDQAVIDIMADSMGQEDEEPSEDDSEEEESEEEETEEEPQEEEEENEEESEEDEPDEEEEQEEEEENAEPFAKLGDQEFKTQEDLIEFAKKQSGYNRFITGNIKKVHPEWFDDDGKLVPERIKEVEKKADEVKEDAEKADKEKKDLTEDEKQKLRDLGIVFQEDLDKIKDDKLDERVDSFLSENPQAKYYSEEIAELIESTEHLSEKRQLTPEQAWNIVKERYDIKEEPDKQDKTYKDGLKDGKKKKGLDDSASSAPKGSSSGVSPGKKAPKDQMDVILDADGIF